MMHNIASDDKYVFEVRNGVMLSLGERIELADGWWFTKNGEPFGPFETDQQALDAASDVSDASVELNLMSSPTSPLPVTDPGEVYPLFSPPADEDVA
jgi:hypothetical protein